MRDPEDLYEYKSQFACWDKDLFYLTIPLFSALAVGRYGFISQTEEHVELFHCFLRLSVQGETSGLYY